MKANELRIGNFVKGKEMNVYWTVEAIDSNSIFSFGKWRSLDAFEPIQLNIEWLLKFGFKYSLRLDDFMFKDKNDIFEIQPYKKGFLNSVVWCDNEILQELKYVHQLQNLYFALNNEELTFIK